jgi:hypothetical protein
LFALPNDEVADLRCAFPVALAEGGRRTADVGLDADPFLSFQVSYAEFTVLNTSVALVFSINVLLFLSGWIFNTALL